MNQITTDVLKTLCYADVFDYPLSLAELHHYLIASSPTPPINPPKLVPSKNGFYFLPHRESIVAIRHKRAEVSRTKLQLARQITAKLARLPSILGIFVTGNLAMSNADVADDIDLLIITQANRLWITRLFITLYLEMLGVRRHPQTAHSGSVQERKRLDSPGVNDYRNQICANLYLDETALALSKAKHNLYTAHEVTQVLPIVNKHYIYERFLSANFWVKQYLPNTVIKPVNQLTNYPINSYSPFELLAYQFQYLYMKRKMTRESISPHSAFFHPRATSQQIDLAYHHRLNPFISLKNPSHQTRKAQSRE